MNKMKYFDVHQHYNFMEFLKKKVEVPENYRQSEYFEEKLIEYCKKLDMKVAVNGCGRCNNSIAFMDMNDEVEAFFKNNKKYIIGIGYVDLDYDTPKKIDELFKREFKGIKVINPKKRYDYKGYDEFYKRCEYFQLPILFHTGISGVRSLKSNSISYNMSPIFLERINIDFPNLKIIGAHLGYAMYDIACALAAWGNGNIYFDICGSDTSLREISEGGYIKKDIPISQIVWGLDEPFIRYEEIISFWMKYFNKIGLSKDEIESIFYKNAYKIFNIEE